MFIYLFIHLFICLFIYIRTQIFVNLFIDTQINTQKYFFIYTLIHSHIKNTILGAERDQFAREKIRQELVLKAESGDTDGIKEMLMMIADEAEKSSSRPR